MDMIDVINIYKRLSPAWYKCQLLIGQWPVHTKPMHPACSYVTSQGSLCCYLKVICIQHREERTKFFSENNEKCRYKYRKTNNAENYFEIFNIPPILMAMCVTFVDSRYKHETLFLMLFQICVFIEVVKLLE
jgi:hypothetical protein